MTDICGVLVVLFFPPHINVAGDGNVLSVLTACCPCLLRGLGALLMVSRELLVVWDLFPAPELLRSWFEAPYKGARIDLERLSLA